MPAQHSVTLLHYDLQRFKESFFLLRYANYITSVFLRFTLRWIVWMKFTSRNIIQLGSLGLIPLTFIMD